MNDSTRVGRGFAPSMNRIGLGGMTHFFITGALKITHIKMTDQIAGHEIARHDKYLFIVVSTNPSIIAVLWKI